MWSIYILIIIYYSNHITMWHSSFYSFLLVYYRMRGDKNVCFTTVVSKHGTEGVCEAVEGNK